MLGRGTEVIVRRAPSPPFVEHEAMCADRARWSFTLIEEVVVNTGWCQMLPCVASSDINQGLVCV